MAKFPLISISSNNRFIQNSDGSPFFYLADTAWELFHRLTLEEITYYFDTRKQQGFNVILSALITEMDGLRIPNAYGLLPFLEMDPGKPDPEYFDFVDQVLRLAEAREIFMQLVPVWGDKIDRVFGIGPEIFDADKAFAYGKWLGTRYKSFSNIIWMNGGDRSGGDNNFLVWDALGRGIKSADPNHLITFHPLGDASSSMWFHDCPWLDFNSCQSGHSMRNYPNFMMIASDYLRTPAKPCLDAESRYEEHAVNWKPDVNGFFNDYDIRQAAYWAVFAGAFGYTYGAHPIWQMYDISREPVGFVRYTWKEALHLKGASQLIYLKNLMLSRPYFSRIPDQSILLSPKAGDEHIRCTRGDHYLFCYLPLGGIVELRSDRIPWESSKAWWFCPATSESSYIGTFHNKEQFCYDSPSQGRGFDWILVLDDVNQNFPAPGIIS